MGISQCNILTAKSIPWFCLVLGAFLGAVVTLWVVRDPEPTTIFNYIRTSVLPDGCGTELECVGQGRDASCTCDDGSTVYWDGNAWHGENM